MTPQRMRVAAINKPLHHRPYAATCKSELDFGNWLNQFQFLAHSSNHKRRHVLSSTHMRVSMLSMPVAPF